MHDAVIMRTLQGIANRRHNAKSFLRRQPFAEQQLPQVHAIHKLHEKEVKPACLPEIMHPDDVGVIESRERVSFLFKTDRKLWIIRPLRRENLQSDQAVQRLLPRLVNHAHAATAQALKNLKLRKIWGKLLGCHRGNLSHSISNLRGFDDLSHQAAGTLGLRNPCWQNGAAVRAAAV